MSQTNIEESLEILEKQGWDMDALLKDFMRGTVSTVDSPIEVGGVVSCSTQKIRAMEMFLARLPQLL